MAGNVSAVLGRDPHSGSRRDRHSGGALMRCSGRSPCLGKWAQNTGHRDGEACSIRRIALTSGCLSEERLAELAEGRLAGDDLARAEHHLATCKPCRALAATAAAAVTCRSEGGADARGALAALQENDRVGRYVIRRVLGAGATGCVYAAHDPALDRTIALKLLRPDAAAPDL